MTLSIAKEKCFFAPEAAEINAIELILLEFAQFLQLKVFFGTFRAEVFCFTPFFYAIAAEHMFTSSALDRLFWQLKTKCAKKMLIDRLDNRITFGY